MLIKNEAKVFKKMEEKVIKRVTNDTDAQRLKVEALMKNPDRAVILPKPPKEHTPKAPPEFIRSIWGSSSGVGSGDFDIYRGMRRREADRQKYNHAMSVKEELDQEWTDKLKQNAAAAKAKTDKKRAKRLKKKAASLKRRKTGVTSKDGTSDSESSQSDEASQDTPDTKTLSQSPPQPIPSPKPPSNPPSKGD